MPSFPKPTFTFNYNANAEINALRHYRENEQGRQIPAKSNNRLLIATWNIANLGLQQRKPNDYKVIAEMISWFDIIALQEVNDNLSGLRSILKNLPNSYKTLFSDKAGNEERMAFKTALEDSVEKAGTAEQAYSQAKEAALVELRKLKQAAEKQQNKGEQVNSTPSTGAYNLKVSIP